MVFWICRTAIGCWSSDVAATLSVRSTPLDAASCGSIPRRGNRNKPTRGSSRRVNGTSAASGYGSLRKSGSPCRIARTSGGPTSCRLTWILEAYQLQSTGEAVLLSGDAALRRFNPVADVVRLHIERSYRPAANPLRHLKTFAELGDGIAYGGFSHDVAISLQSARATGGGRSLDAWRKSFPTAR